MEITGRPATAKLVKEDSIPAHLRCNSCSQLLWNGFQTAHGCRLCQHCVDTKLVSQIRRICPCTHDSCRDEDVIRDRFVSLNDCSADTATRLEVSELIVHCPNFETGCQERCAWRHLNSHLVDNCQFEIVMCQRCSQEVVQHKLHHGSHMDLQSIDCCPSFRGHCPLCKDANILMGRVDFLEHVKTCPERNAQCKYAMLDCPVSTTPQQLIEHYKSGCDEHLTAVAAQLQKMDKQLKQMGHFLMKERKKNDKKDARLSDLEERLLHLERTHDVKDKCDRQTDTEDLNHPTCCAATRASGGYWDTEIKDACSSSSEAARMPPRNDINITAEDAVNSSIQNGNESDDVTSESAVTIFHSISTDLMGQLHAPMDGAAASVARTSMTSSRASVAAESTMPSTPTVATTTRDRRRGWRLLYWINYYVYPPATAGTSSSAS